MFARLTYSARRAWSAPTSAGRPSAPLKPRPALSQRSPLRRPILISLIVILAAGGSLVTAALWQAQTTQAAVISAGDLKLNLGQLTWACADQCASGDRTDLADFALGPDQSVILSQAVVSNFVGDNLVVSLSAEFAQPPAGWSASWHVTTSGGTSIPSAGDQALAQPIILPAALNGSASAWTVVIRLTAPSDAAHWIDPTSSGTPNFPPISFGQLTLSANQVRCGSGFDITCEPEEMP